MKTAALFWLACFSALCGCEGQGTGQLQGTLSLQGCPMPQQFSLDPAFFAAEPILPPILGEDTSQDMRGVNQLVVRMQRSSQLPERTDVFELWLVDEDYFQQQPAHDVQITAPDLTKPYVPLPTSGPRVLASLALNGTCPFAQVQPVLTGTARFNQLGLQTGDLVDGSVSLTATDPREQRGMQPPAASGMLTGYFSFRIQRGPSSVTY